MSYKAKTIESMSFYLLRKYDAITKLDAIKELKTIWHLTDVKDMVKAYENAFND